MHFLRPLYVVLAVLGAIVVVRTFVMPDDFGVHEGGYMYGWYRQGNIEDWKAIKVKYRGKAYCKDCHADEEHQILSSPHRIIECENCHGPALDHPGEPARLDKDRSRELCLRCHAHLPYRATPRGEIEGIDPDKHNPGVECVTCHNPHKASKPF